MEPNIQKFKKKGLIFLWAYTENSKNFPGWNISFDKEGADFLIHLLDLMNKSTWSSKKSIATNSPTVKLLMSVNNRMGNAGWAAARELILHHKKETKSGFWDIVLKHKVVTITFGPDELIELINSIRKAQMNESDFAISDINSKNILYFWSSY